MSHSLSTFMNNVGGDLMRCSGTITIIDKLHLKKIQLSILNYLRDTTSTVFGDTVFTTAIWITRCTDWQIYDWPEAELITNNLLVAYLKLTFKYVHYKWYRYHPLSLTSIPCVSIHRFYITLELLPLLNLTIRNFLSRRTVVFRLRRVQERAPASAR